MRLAITYAVLAIMAGLANLTSQYLFGLAYNGAFAITLSVMMGTGAGLIVKYLLDKRFIFKFQAKDAIHDGQTFFLYTCMGGFTTGIFWGFEFGFNYMFELNALRYLGGALGLALGYYCKYRLDKRFVFRSRKTI